MLAYVLRPRSAAVQRRVIVLIYPLPLPRCSLEWVAWRRGRTGRHCTDQRNATLTPLRCSCQGYDAYCVSGFAPRFITTRRLALHP